MIRRNLVAVLVAILALPAPAHADSSFVPPVDAPVAARFDEPDGRYGSGHRGIDYSIGSGTGVRAIGPGRVLFAGPVPGGWAVAVAHDGDIVSTYSILADVSVRKSDLVEAGEWLGHSDVAHSGVEGFHLGLKVAGRYVDPDAYLVAFDMSDAIHLAPLTRLDPFESQKDDCREGDPASMADAPNDNVIVEVAGIASHTAGGISSPLYTHGAAELGYPEDRIYEFSYKGHGGPDLHQPYSARDTEGDLREAGRRLQELLIEIAQRHPGAPIDVLAHSQGGLIVRAMLDDLADSWDPRLPEIAHVITFSTPHGGAPLAGEMNDLRSSTLTGRYALEAASWWADRGVPLPDPRSPAVRQLAPGSGFLEELAREDVAFGTRFLSIGMTHDLIVPPDRAILAEHPSRVLGPSGLSGHSSVVTADAGRPLIHSFLRDAPLQCPGVWDALGPWIGRGVSLLQGATDRIYSAAEEAVGGRVIRVGQGAVRILGKLIKRT